MDDWLSRDFRKDGKYDEGGHPLNGVVLEAEKFCTQHGHKTDTSFVTEEAGVACSGKLAPQPWGDLVANIRMRPIGVDVTSGSDVVKLQVKAGDQDPVSVVFQGTSFAPARDWTFMALHFSQADDIQLSVETFGNGAVEIDYIEIFKNEMELTLGPGSRVLSDDDVVTLETTLDSPIPAVTVNGDEFPFAALVDHGTIQHVTTTYRQVYSLTVRQLAQAHAGDLDVLAKTETSAGRMIVYRAVPPCMFEGDTGGAKVMITGFQPFPANADHENISEVAVRALDPSVLGGVQVMRLVLPVEWDYSPARVVEAMQRCRPDVVVDMGQGGGGIDLEHVAQNLKDSGNDDNRGHFQGGTPILDGGQATLPSGLPLPVVKLALQKLLADSSNALHDVNIDDSDDAGHYICNNTFYSVTQAAQALGIRAGFIHLPYATEFSDAQRAAWGQVAATIVQAVAAQN
jgi:pyroglutamyl-peptidase